jgi:hypothetical protein
MRDLTDEEILKQSSEITHTPVQDIANHFGMKTGQDRSALGAGWFRVGKD